MPQPTRRPFASYFQLNTHLEFMASGETTRTALTIVLGIIIVVLGFLLYRTITVPAERLDRQQELTEATRARMTNIREALIRYEREYNEFPGTLDSLVMFVEQDSLMQAINDSLYGATFEADSLPFSPRTGDRFIYEINDTSDVNVYLLQDPNQPRDSIGTLQPDPTQVNAASWE